MAFFVTGLPVTVALAVVATIAYLFGRRSRPAVGESRIELRREMKRAKHIARDMEQIVRRVRRGLASHHASVLKFTRRVDSLSQQPQEDVCQHLCEEAERMLKPTMRLAAQIAQAYDEMRQQTTHLMSLTEFRTDPLTGLPNRRALDEALQKSISLRSRYDTPFSLAIFDIDQFKALNDEYGHPHGDSVLQSVARVFEYCVRDTDTIARYGGEEFVVVLVSSDLEDACIFAERLRQAIEAAPDVPVTVSGGVAEALESDSPRTLLTRADSALYSAKAAGRNRIFRHSGGEIESFRLPATADAAQQAEEPRSETATPPSQQLIPPLTTGYPTFPALHAEEGLEGPR
jgi:diguanylate cyclase (GGDEF)-like protein